MKLSIVIPAHGDQAAIDDTVISVLENRPFGCEIILVHPDSYVDPYELDDELRLVPSSADDRISLFNDGMAAAHGKIIHTMSPGVIATADWCDSAIEAFEEDADLGALSPRLFIGNKKKPVIGVDYHPGYGKTTLRGRRTRVLAPTLESGFYLRSAMLFMHGFDVSYSTFADVELGLRMKSANYRCICERDVELTQSVAAQSAPAGFQTGKTRGRLFRRAKQLGGTDAGPGLWYLLTEPFRHGFGLSMILGSLGRLNCGSPKQDVPATVSFDQGDTSDRQAA